MQQLEDRGVPIDMQWEYMQCMNPCKQICDILMVVGVNQPLSSAAILTRYHITSRGLLINKQP